MAQVRLKQIATQAINQAITERISQGGNFEKLIDWRTDGSGKIKGFMLNYAEHMKVTADAVNTVQDVLRELERVPKHIPLGQAMNSSILASFGPDIPVRLVPAGSVRVDLETRHHNAGVNMLLVEVYIRIIAEVSIIIPFDSEPEIVETEVPISYVLVVGDVPMYYFDNKGNPTSSPGGVPPPGISLPPLGMQPSDSREPSGSEATDVVSAKPADGTGSD